MEVDVGLVRYQRKEVHILMFRLLPKKKVARSLCLVPAIFQAKMQLVGAKNKKSKVENCCLFLTTRSDDHQIINTML